MAVSYNYNPKTGKWTKSKVSETQSTTTKEDVSKIKKDSGDNLTSSNSDSKSATGQAEKEYNEIELNTLQGTLDYIVTEETIKLQAGDTVKLKGLGKFLSGNYYVKEVVRKIGSNGYTQTANVIKTDFGDKLKSTKKGKETSKTKKVKSSASKSSKTKTYKVKKGDTFYTIAKKQYNKSSYASKIAKANSLKVNAKLKQGQTIKLP